MVWIRTLCALLLGVRAARGFQITPTWYTVSAPASYTDALVGGRYVALGGSTVQTQVYSFNEEDHTLSMWGNLTEQMTALKDVYDDTLYLFNDTGVLTTCNLHDFQCVNSPVNMSMYSRVRVGNKYIAVSSYSDDLSEDQYCLYRNDGVYGLQGCVRPENFTFFRSVEMDTQGDLLVLSDENKEDIVVYNVSHSMGVPVLRTLGMDVFVYEHVGGKCGHMVRITRNSTIHVACTDTDVEAPADDYAYNPWVYDGVLSLQIEHNRIVGTEHFNTELNTQIGRIGVTRSDDLFFHTSYSSSGVITGTETIYFKEDISREWYEHSYFDYSKPSAGFYISRHGVVYRNTMGVFEVHKHPALGDFSTDINYRLPDLVAVLRPSDPANRRFGCDMKHSGVRLYVASCQDPYVEVFLNHTRVTTFQEKVLNLDAAGEDMMTCNNGYGLATRLNEMGPRGMKWFEGVQIEVQTLPSDCTGVTPSLDGKFIAVLDSQNLVLIGRNGIELTKGIRVDPYTSGFWNGAVHRFAVRENGQIFMFTPKYNWVRVFLMVGGEFQEATASLSFPSNADNIGSSVSYHGGRMAIGAMKTRIYGDEENGAVFVLHQSGTLREVHAPVRTLRFGRSVAIEGDLLAVSADVAQRGDMGAVFVYEWDGVDWNHKHTIADPTLSSETMFGYRVQLVNSLLYVSCPLNLVPYEPNTDVHAHIRVYQLDLGAGPGTLPPSTARPTFAPTLRPTGAPRTVQDASPSEDAPQGALIGGVVGGVCATGCALAYYLWRKYGGYTPTRKSIY